MTKRVFKARYCNDLLRKLMLSECNQNNNQVKTSKYPKVKLTPELQSQLNKYSIPTFNTKEKNSRNCKIDSTVSKHAKSHKDGQQIRLRPITKTKILMNIEKIFDKPKLNNDIINRSVTPHLNSQKFKQELFNDSVKEFVDKNLLIFKNNMQNKKKEWASPFLKFKHSTHEIIKQNHSKAKRFSRKQIKDTPIKEHQEQSKENDQEAHLTEYSPIIDYKNGNLILSFIDTTKNETSHHTSFIGSTRGTVANKTKSIFAKRMGKKDYRHLFSNRRIKSLRDI